MYIGYNLDLRRFMNKIKKHHLKRGLEKNNVCFKLNTLRQTKEIKNNFFKDNSQY